MLDKSYEEQVLVILTQSSAVFIFFPQDWGRNPIKIDNHLDDFDDNSVWSCAIYGKTLAVGSNTHEISLWDLDTQARRRLRLHDHNIPCLDFNSKGALASTSIDSGIAVYIEGSPILYTKPCTEWGWGIKWIPRNSVCIVKTMPTTNMNVLTGRYRSSLPTTYYNVYADIRGQFDIAHAGQYFNALTRRIQGLPDFSESDSEDYLLDSEMLLDKEDENQELDDFLIIQTSKSTIHLIDPSISTGKENNVSNMHVLAVFIPSLQILPGNFSRLSLLLIIPEFSLCIIGNQFGPEIILLRICKMKNPGNRLGWDYGFRVEIPLILDGKILALSQSNYNDYAFIFALTESMTFYTFKISKHEVEKMNEIRI
jgi:hypothetical protein